MASTNLFASFAAVASCIIFCLLMTTTTALPMKDVIGKAMMEARLQQQHREKRAVTTSNCSPPENLEQLFQNINSNVNGTQFLHPAISNQAISVPEDEEFVVKDGDPNETRDCPTTLASDMSYPLAHRSLCPYYFNIIQLPQGYYPSTLKTAACKCQTCVEHNSYGCESIKMKIAVLRPIGCLQGLQRYQEKLVEVSTGCTCAFSNTQTTTAAPPSTTTAFWGVD